MENVARISDEELQDNIERLEQVLEDFKVPAKVNNVQVGPAVTRYELTMPRGISVNKIAQMADDIAMTLASNGSIRVEAPIPGKNSFRTAIRFTRSFAPQNRAILKAVLQKSLPPTSKTPRA
jgi:DNA segregation ATPase FtsK/SpoIIIE-like protein